MSETVKNLEGVTGCRLPKEYKNFLDANPAGARFDDLKNKGVEWILPSLTPRVAGFTIGERINFSGCEIFFFEQIRQISKDIQLERVDFIEIENGASFALSRMEKVVTIGVSGFDTLFLDPSDNFSVWAYWNSTRTVEELAADFAQWITYAVEEKIDFGAKSVTQSSFSQRDFLGIWKPVSSKVLAQDLVNDYSTYHFKENGDCLEYDYFGDTVDCKWKIHVAGGRSFLVIESSETRIAFQIEGFEKQYTRLNLDIGGDDIKYMRAR